MPARSGCAITVVGGPTALLEIGGLRLLIDPTFDPPGEHPIGPRVLTKTAGPALGVDDLGAIDAVLLSHDQHPDNLDDLGRVVVERAPITLTTAAAADRLGGTAVELPLWRHVDLDRPDGTALRVTGVPAQHGPEGTTDLTGPVTGFVLSGDEVPTVYVSGDNASLSNVQAIAVHHGPVDVALLFAGAARTALLDAYLTLTSDQVVQAAQILDATKVVVLHVDGWAHFTQGPDEVVTAFERAGLADRLVRPEPGVRTDL